jgi:hypothetical protein
MKRFDERLEAPKVAVITQQSADGVLHVELQKRLWFLSGDRRWHTALIAKPLQMRPESCALLHEKARQRLAAESMTTRPFEIAKETRNALIQAFVGIGEKASHQRSVVLQQCGDIARTLVTKQRGQSACCVDV